MRISTLDLLRCPTKQCGNRIAIAKQTLMGEAHADEIRYGELRCTGCESRYPIVEGIAVVSPSPLEVLRFQRELVSRKVNLDHLSEEVRAVIAEPVPESPRRVNHDQIVDWSEAAALLTREEGDWWSTEDEGDSAFLSSVLKQYWNDGPISRVVDYFERNEIRRSRFLDLGCGVGGAVRRLGKFAEASLGIDRSFSALLKARALMFGETTSLRTDADLLKGSMTRETRLASPPASYATSDFVLGDILSPPVEFGAWPIVMAFGVIDVIADPVQLPEVHARLASPEGLVIQGSPYHWTDRGARMLREAFPEAASSSATMAEHLYAIQKLSIVERQEDVPWMIYKYSRQVVMYAFHFFIAHKSESAKHR